MQKLLCISPGLTWQPWGKWTSLVWCVTTEKLWLQSKHVMSWCLEWQLVLLPWIFCIGKIWLDLTWPRGLIKSTLTPRQEAADMISDSVQLEADSRTNDISDTQYLENGIGNYFLFCCSSDFEQQSTAVLYHYVCFFFLVCIIHLMWVDYSTSVLHQNISKKCKHISYQLSEWRWCHSTVSS